jgi:hypothetical protein
MLKQVQHDSFNYLTVRINYTKEEYMFATEQVKILLVKEHLSVVQLAELLNKDTDKHFTAQGLHNKMHRGTLRYDEVNLIAAVLGYEIKIEKK